MPRKRTIKKSFWVDEDEDDKFESNSITNQKIMINQFIKEEKDMKKYDYYIDDGVSGTTFERPGFNRMISDLKKGKINTIIVKDLSRFGRNYIGAGNFFDEVFPIYETRFISLGESIDSFKNPDSLESILVPMKNLMNDQYARDVSKKVRSVLDIKRTDGQFIGSTPPFGYLKNPRNKHRFIIDKYSAKVVKKIFKMILDGKSRTQVANELNDLKIPSPLSYKRTINNGNYQITDSTELWKTKTVDRILNNESYTGVLIQGKRKRVSYRNHKNLHVDPKDWIRIEEHHESIISKSDFNKVQDIIYNRYTRINKNKQLDVFSGYLKCSDCGDIYVFRKSKGYEYYYCATYLKEKSCLKNSIKKDKLEEVVLELLNNQISLFCNLNNEIEKLKQIKPINLNNEILYEKKKVLEQERFKYENLINDTKEDVKNGYISEDEFKEYTVDYKIELKDVKHSIKNIEEQLKNEVLSNENISWLENFIRNEKITKLTKKIVDEFINEIIIYNKNTIKVTFKYENEYILALDYLNKTKYDII